METLSEYLKVIDENMISFIFVLLLISIGIVSLFELVKWIWKKIKNK